MKLLLFFIGLMAFQSYGQIDCNDLPEKYTGTCIANYDNGVIAKEYIFKDGKVIAAKEYSTFGELERAITIEDEHKLSFTEAYYLNGKTKISTLTLTDGNGFYEGVNAGGQKRLHGEVRKGYPVGVWEGFDAYQRKRVEVHFGPAPKGRSTYDVLEGTLKELSAKMEKCIRLGIKEDTVIVLKERMPGQEPPKYISCEEFGEYFTGTCENFYVDGKIERRQEYDNGNLIYDLRFDRKGDTTEYLYAGGKYDLTLTFKKYFAGNQLMTSYSTVDGTGQYVAYHRNGKKKVEGAMADSACTGKWFYYDTSGRLLVELTDKGVDGRKCHSGAQLQRVIKEAEYFMREVHTYALDANKPLPYVVDDRQALMQEARAYYKEKETRENQKDARVSPPVEVPVANTDLAVPVPPPAPVIREEVVVAPEIIEFPDKEAEYPGGEKAMLKFIAENMVYPQDAINMGIQGKVYLSFVIETDGRPTNIKVERGVERSLDREAKRVVRIMPNWTPGEVRGKKVRTRVRLPIIFALD